VAVSAQPLAVTVAGGAPLRLLATVAAGAFVTAFDSSAVNAALPLLRDGFGASIGAIQWVLTAGLAVTTALLLVFGRLGDLVGNRRVYLWGFRVFLPGCILCASAGALPALVAARAFQSVGAAMLLASAPALLARSLPARKRGGAFGAKAGALYLGLIAGAALGGWAPGRFGWRSIFWMQVPLALGAFVLALRYIPSDPQSKSTSRFDVAGSAVWACIPVSLLLALERGRVQLPHAASRLGLAAVLLMLIAALVAIERRSENPLLEFSCFKRVEFSASAAGLLAAFASSYVLNFALPFYIVEVLRQKNAVAGGLLAAGALARAAVAPFGGCWSDHVDRRWLTVSGTMLLAGALGFLARGGVHLRISSVACAVIAAGLGLGCFVPANNSTLVGHAPPGCYGAAGGILTTSRTLGMSLGVALAGAILSGPAPLTRSLRFAFAAGMLLAVMAAAASWLAPPEIRPKSPTSG
jgi:EmrB/QacA subfamily drug resistance transporter